MAEKRGESRILALARMLENDDQLARVGSAVLRRQLERATLSRLGRKVPASTAWSDAWIDGGTTWDNHWSGDSWGDNWNDAWDNDWSDGSTGWGDHWTDSNKVSDAELRGILEGGPDVRFTQEEIHVLRELGILRSSAGGASGSRP